MKKLLFLFSLVACDELSDPEPYWKLTCEIPGLFTEIQRWRSHEPIYFDTEKQAYIVKNDLYKKTFDIEYVPPGGALCRVRKFDKKL